MSMIYFYKSHHDDDGDDDDDCNNDVYVPIHTYNHFVCECKNMCGVYAPSIRRSIKFGLVNSNVGQIL